MLPEADALLAPVTEIDGVRMACLIDASSGMVLASRQERDDDMSLPAAAAGATDIAHVLSLLTSDLGTDAPEDVMVTFRDHFQVIRLVRPDAEPRILLLVVLDRRRANLAMARLGIRSFCADLAAS
jgi:hypothetical protein